MKHALELENLQIRFPGFRLGPLNLVLERGRIVGLVGPNGSGKTTTIRCIAGNLVPDAGSIRVCDHLARHEDGRWKAWLGYVPDLPVFYEWMTASEFLHFLSGYYAGWSDTYASALVERFQLEPGQRVRDLSRGNRVKLSLVGALAHRPSLALFDEPTAGLDPVVRTEVFEVLAEMMEDEEMTVLYSTHILDDLHRLADELVFLRNGHVQCQEDKATLIDRWRSLRFRWQGELPAVPAVRSSDRRGDLHEIVSSDGVKTIEALSETGIDPIDVQPLTLEEIAVSIMRER